MTTQKEPVHYAYPLGIQLVLPEQFEQNEEFRKILELLYELGFSFIELNIADPGTVNPEALKRYLLQYGLTMTMFASGLPAQLHSLNLSDPDTRNRNRSIDYCRRYIDFSVEMNSGIILGLIQGQPVSDKDAAMSRFRTSLDLLVPYAEEKGVKLLIEATNRSLTSVANTAEETKHLIAPYPPCAAGLLLDTYHMAIEEKNPLKVISEYIPGCISIHFSDNNRLYPGLGTIDFPEITACMKKARFKGMIVLEANIHTSLEEDLRTSIAYLSMIPG